MPYATILPECDGLHADVHVMFPFGSRVLCRFKVREPQSSFGLDLQYIMGLAVSLRAPLHGFLKPRRVKVYARTIMGSPEHNHGCWRQVDDSGLKVELGFKKDFVGILRHSTTHREHITPAFGLQVLPGGLKSDMDQWVFKNGFNPAMVRHDGGLVRRTCVPHARHVLSGGMNKSLFMPGVVL